jgi:hypothetical protein
MFIEHQSHQTPKPQRGDMCPASESPIRQMTQTTQIIVRIRILRIEGFSG